MVTWIRREGWLYWRLANGRSGKLGPFPRARPPRDQRIEVKPPSRSRSSHHVLPSPTR